MFIDRLLNDGSSPVLEQVIRFSAERHRLITENIANVDTVEYRQKDLSVQKFQAALRKQVEARRAGRPATFADLRQQVEQPAHGILFHDCNNRSMEQLATDLAKNAMMHNFAIELLRKQYQTMNMALNERLA